MKSKTTLLFALIICVISACGKEAKVYDQALAELDRTLDDREVIAERLEASADSLKCVLAEAQDYDGKYAACRQVLNKYIRFDLDSALVYAHLGQQLARQSGNPDLICDAELALARRYVLSGMYLAALELVQSLDPSSVPQDHLYSYYNNLVRIYHGLYLTDKDPVWRQQLRAKVLYYSSCVTEDMCTPYQSMMERVSLLMDEGQPELVRSILFDYLESGTSEETDYAEVHYWIAKSYKASSDLDNEILHFAISARYDLLVSNKDSRSMVNLANRFFRLGEIERAFKYMVSAYEVARRSDSRIVLEKINQFLPEIISSYESARKKSTDRLKLFLLIVVVLLFGLGVLLVVIYADRNKMRKMQVELQRNMDELRSSYQINSTYIGRYMLMFSEHIDSLERYRSSLRVTAKTNDMHDIQQALRDDSVIENEIKTLFDGFDETFLALFPNFVAQVNALLKDEAKIGANLKPGHLSNELRIFALIRLGVTDSVAIAKFLRKSPSTIYNYRVKLRNAALGDRDDFEKELMKIGV